MTADIIPFRPKTIAEQQVEYFEEQRLVRKLSNEEWEQLRRAEHAVYCRNLKLAKTLEREMHEGALKEYQNYEEASRRRCDREAGR